MEAQAPAGMHHWTDLGVASWYDFAVAIQDEALARGLLTRAATIAPITTAEYPTRARRPAFSVLDTRATRALVADARGALAPQVAGRCSMSFVPHNLCITGGAGFIGANFVRHWLERTREGRVVVLDALTYAGNVANLQGLERDPRYVFVRGDICDETAVRALLEGHEIDTLVHFAAESHVDRSILGPDEFIRTNVLGTHALLKAAKSLWLDRRMVAAHRFHHVSTDEVYGSLGAHDAAFSESSPYMPNSPYSASKAGSDHLVRAYHETYGLDTTVTNCSNNYGPYQFPEKLIPLTLITSCWASRFPSMATASRCAIGCMSRITARPLC